MFVEKVGRRLQWLQRAPAPGSANTSSAVAAVMARSEPHVERVQVVALQHALPFGLRDRHTAPVQQPQDLFGGIRRLALGFALGHADELVLLDKGAETGEEGVGLHQLPQEFSRRGVFQPGFNEIRVVDGGVHVSAVQSVRKEFGAFLEDAVRGFVARAWHGEDVR
ncbi:hypothetical protein [Yinghuangia sp. YIM S09857]|uniref:hypothetical protein n=1 Tax=Yinghuangia sp. YIM S09857 TaxID=3436929 RepID=UPI003F53E0B3